MTRLTFTTHEDDARGFRCLQILSDLGCETRVLQEDQRAEPFEVALFTTPTDTVVQGSLLRLAAHRLVELAPEWASQTPFVVAINRQGKLSLEPLERMAVLYERWLIADELLAKAPWLCPNVTLSATNQGLLNNWQRRAIQVITSLSDGFEKTEALWVVKENYEQRRRRHRRRRSRKHHTHVSFAKIP